MAGLNKNVEDIDKSRMQCIGGFTYSLYLFLLRRNDTFGVIISFRVKRSVDSTTRVKMYKEEKLILRKIVS